MTVVFNVFKYNVHYIHYYYLDTLCNKKLLQIKIRLKQDADTNSVLLKVTQYNMNV